MKKDEKLNCRLIKSRRCDKGIVTGFRLPPVLFKACLEQLKTYDYLKKNLSTLDRIGDGIYKFTPIVEKRTDLQLRLQEMEDAFAEIPGQYHDAIHYLLKSRDSKENQRMKLEEEYELEYKEAQTWLIKLVYFYADRCGYPVPHSGEQYIFEITDEGDIEVTELD